MSVLLVAPQLDDGGPACVAPKLSLRAPPPAAVGVDFAGADREPLLAPGPVELELAGSRELAAALGASAAGFCTEGFCKTWPGFDPAWELLPVSAIGALLPFARLSGVEAVSFTLEEASAASAVNGSLFNRACGAVSSAWLRVIPAASVELG